MASSIPKPPNDIPQVGEVYQHYKGTLYLVVGIELDEASLKWRILYTPYTDGMCPASFWSSGIIPWGRSFDGWTSLAQKGDQLVYRFTYYNTVH